MDKSRGFIAQEKELWFYNAKALIDVAFSMFYADEDETTFDLPGYSSAYLRVYNDDKREQLLKNFVNQLTQSGSESNVLVINASVLDMTFEDQGPYYFELGYMNGGYEVPLRYGALKII